MNISCVICSDLFIQTDEVYITECGHMFHYTCLQHWLERSKTCPQCRRRCTDKTIHRVYFNLANTDGITDDVGTLMNKLHNIQFQLTLKEKDVKIYTEKYNKAKRQGVTLREEVVELENKIRVHESGMFALKDQVSYFKSKARENDRLSEELTKLKNNVRDMENVQLVINGTREQVNEMIRNENNIESMAILAATLKKSLLDAEKKKRDMEYNLKRSQNDATRYRREVNTLESQNSELRREIQHMKDSFEKEKQFLKNKILELNKKISSNLDINNTSLNRIIQESPVNCSRKPKLCLKPAVDTISLNETDSPTMVEKVQKILDANSPYLNIRSSNVAIDYTSILNSKTKIGASKSGFSIFKPSTKPLESVKASISSSDVVYNGLGSSSKDDIFPSPRPVQAGLKRHKSSSLTSSKYRKLAPGPNKIKVTDFLNQSSSQ